MDKFKINKIAAMFFRSYIRPSLDYGSTLYANGCETRLKKNENHSEQRVESMFGSNELNTTRTVKR